MRFAVAVVATGMAAVLAAAAAPARPDAPPPSAQSRTLVVGYASDAALRRALRMAPATIVRQLPRLHAVEVRPRDRSTFAARVAPAAGIDYVHAPVTRRAFVEPALAPAGVPGGAFQWQYAVTGADRVPARVARGALMTTVAVIDSGADLTAPDISAKRPHSYNAMDGSRDVLDDVGHGTFVASLAAGSSTNGDGIAGMAGEAQLITIKASPNGGMTDFDLAAAIAHAVDRGARVINLSFGGTSYSAVETRAIAYAVARDVLLVAAAGNEYLRGNPVEYPAALLQPVGSNGVGGVGLSVGATTITGARAPFSNTGSYISLAAPGEDVFAAVSKDSSPKHYPRVPLPGSSAGLYGYSSGTSFAAPQVAGAAALVWGANRLLSSRQVTDVLKETASNRGAWNPETGFGVIDVAAAVERARTLAGVSLRASKLGDRAHLTWRGSLGTRSYRLLASVGGGPFEVVLDRTNESSHIFAGGSGKSYAFVVESLDSAGAVIARSAPAVVTLGASPVSLRLQAVRVRQQRKPVVVLVALLKPRALDVRAGNRIVSVEQWRGRRWQLVGFQFTDAAGRAAWLVPAGTHRVRARFGGSSELIGAVSRPLVVRGPKR